MASQIDVLPMNGRSNEALKAEESLSDYDKGEDFQIENGPGSLEDADVKDTDTDNVDPAYSALPQLVRELCDFEDDPHMPVLTWRFYFLSAIFTALGAWLTQMGFFRTTYVPYSIYFVQIASLYVGRLLALLPETEIGLRKLKFQLNPGPFSLKEHVAIVIAANTGATNNLGDYVVVPLAIFFDAPMNGWLAILFMISAVFIGFSYATLARMFLIENPATLFPLTLQQATVFKAMRKSLENESKTAKKQMRVFWLTILVFFVWQFLPEYVFPFLSSLAILCWVSTNPKTQFLGSGLGGAGLLNITLDWSNISSTVIVTPYWAQLNIYAAYFIAVWVLIPIGYFTGAWGSDIYPIQTQTLYLRNGTRYPTARLMNHDFTLNKALFDEIGPPMMSAQLRWAYFWSYAAWLGSFMTLVLFQGPIVWAVVKSQWKGRVHYNDKLTQIIRTYPQVPLWWNVAMFIGPFIVLTVLTAKGVLYMPSYMLFIGLVIGAVIVVPMAYIYAISGFQIPVGYFNELFYGYVIDLGGSRHPVGLLSYRVISGQCWYEAQAMLSDMKLGHYFHIPPRATLIAQIWGICIGVPINYATILWVVKAKGDILTGAATDPNRQWTGQTIISLYNQGITFALVGPKRLFDDPVYAPMLYGFIVGAIVPSLLYLGHRWKPQYRFDLWHLPIFATAFEIFYGNISNVMFTNFILASVNHLYIKTRHYEFWKKYAYLWGAGADTGFNFNMLILFIAFSAVKTIPMPAWWGNNPDSVERCFHVGG